MLWVQADGEVRPAAVVPHGVEPSLGQRKGAALQERGVVPPGLDEVVVIEAEGDADCRPEPLHVGGAEDLLGPARVGRGDDGPGDVAPEQEPSRLRGVGGVEHRASRGIETVEEVRFRVTRQADERPAVRCSLEVAQDLVLPRQVRPEHRLGGVRHGGAPDVVVVVEHLDTRGAGPVGVLGHRTGQLGVLDEAAENHELARLDVDADPDDELGVAVDPADRFGVDGHAGHVTPPSWPAVR